MARWNPFRKPADPEADFAQGRFEQARAGFAARITERQKLLQKRPDDVELSAVIAGDLNNLGLCLGKLRRFTEAADVLTGSVTIFQMLGPEFRGALAGTLQTLAGALGEGGQLDRAMTVSREAVEVRRSQPSDNRPPAVRANETARTLRMFAHVRAEADAELDEAQAALTEALTLQMDAVQRQPAMESVNEIYVTELVQARILTKQGRVADAQRLENLVRRRHLDAMVMMLGGG
jgi:tetratricopeptide (TPR) repeat protein